MYVPLIVRRTTFALALLTVVGASGHAQRPAQDSTLTLESAIGLAVATHPLVRAAAAAVRSAEGSRTTARSVGNPVFSHQAEAASSATAGAGPAIEREVMTSVMLPLDPLFQLVPRASQAGALVRAARADLAATRRDVALDAASAFFAAAGATVRVDALKDVRTWLDSLVGYTQARVREGASAEVDLIRLQVEQLRTETDLAMAQADAARARAQLAVAVGVDSFTIDLGADTACNCPQPPSRDALLALARTRRPEILAADARLSAARSGVSLERTRFLRDIGIMAGVKTMGTERVAVTGLSLPIPLFDQNRGETRRADSERRMAEFQREQVRRQVDADVNASHVAATTLTGNADLSNGALVRRAEEARRIAEAAYREGATPLFQVLDAARALAEARQVSYAAIAARQQSVLQLNAAIGVTDLPAMLSMPTSSPQSRDSQSSTRPELQT